MRKGRIDLVVIAVVVPPNVINPGPEERRRCSRNEQIEAPLRKGLCRRADAANFVLGAKFEGVSNSILCDRKNSSL